jgi:hypothetical protein
LILLSASVLDAIFFSTGIAGMGGASNFTTSGCTG